MRKSVNIRLNEEELEVLEGLAGFYGMTERSIVKFAFQQLAIATHRLQKEIDNAKTNNNHDFVTGPNLVQPGTATAGSDTSNSTTNKHI